MGYSHWLSLGPEQGQGPIFCRTIHTGCVWGQTWTFPVPVQVPVPGQVQCERFFLKPYNPLFLIQVPIPETASVNTPLLCQCLNFVGNRV